MGAELKLNLTVNGTHTEGRLAPAVCGGSWFFEIAPAPDALEIEQK